MNVPANLVWGNIIPQLSSHHFSELFHKAITSGDVCFIKEFLIPAFLQNKEYFSQTHMVDQIIMFALEFLTTTEITHIVHTTNFQFPARSLINFSRWRQISARNDIEITKLFVNETNAPNVFDVLVALDLPATIRQVTELGFTFNLGHLVSAMVHFLNKDSKHQIETLIEIVRDNINQRAAIKAEMDAVVRATSFGESNETSFSCDGLLALSDTIHHLGKDADNDPIIKNKVSRAIKHIKYLQKLCASPEFLVVVLMYNDVINYIPLHLDDAPMWEDY